MSPFIIFVILVTLVLLLYYATIIWMDIAAMSKKENEQGETISAGDRSQQKEEEEQEPAPKTVVENPETGTFEFQDSPVKIEEARAEAPSEPSQEVEPKQNESAPEEPGSSEKVEPNQPERVEEPTSSGTAPETPQPEEAEDHPEEEEDDPNISTVDFTDEPPVDEASDELFDESKAFNPDLAQVEYGVTTLIGEKKDPVVEKIVASTNEKMQPCTFSLSNLHTESELTEEINNPKTNIEHTDEATQY